MILSRMKSINKNQRGFTLIEMLIAMAITGLVTGGITMTLFQVFNINALSTNRMIAVRQVQNAGYWVSHDAQMAQSMVTTGASGFPFTLTWTDWGGTVHQVVYTLVDSELRRDYNGEQMLVAEFIDPANTSFGLTGGSFFSMPDGNIPQDVFTITDPIGGDYGTISITSSGDVVRATAVGNATINGILNGSEIINIANSPMAWSIPIAGGAIIVTANSNSFGIIGSWTSTTGTATATMTTDSDDDAYLSGGGALNFTATATVGTGSQETSETRVYEVIPRPNL